MTIPAAMNRRLHCFLAGIAVFAFVFAATAAPRAEHVFIFVVDGGKPAVIKESEMPVLKKFAADGACTWEARTISPSVTLPAITSMLTGVTLAKHKLSWNSWRPDRGLVTVPTVFSEAKKAGFSTAMFVGKEKFRHLLLPDSVDEFDFNSPLSGQVTKTMEGETRPMSEGTVLSGTVAKDAAAYIGKKKPGLCFIHFTDTDDVGHKYGWGSPEQKRAFNDIDGAIGVVFRAIQDAGLAGNSVLILTADHGGHARTHGGNTPDDMIIPWIVWGKGVRKGFEIPAPVNICDTAATALWLLDVPQPANLDGKPVSAAFE